MSLEEIVANYRKSIDAAIANVENEALGLKFRAAKADFEFRLVDSRDLLKRYLDTYPHDIEGQQTLMSSFAQMTDFEGAAGYVDRFVDDSHDDPIQINALLNNILFAGHVDAAVGLARESVRRFPQHAFLAYQAHRVLLWAGHTEEAAALVDPLRRSEYPEDNILLVLIRQACAEGDREAAEVHFGKLEEFVKDQPGTEYIGMMVLGRPDEAHQRLVERNLDNWGLASFLIYPYFDHSYFPEMAAILERQGIDRDFIDVPPYACKPDQS